jgi:hypothetical protein
MSEVEVRAVELVKWRRDTRNAVKVVDVVDNHVIDHGIVGGETSVREVPEPRQIKPQRHVWPKEEVVSEERMAVVEEDRREE